MADGRPPRQLRCQIQRAISRRDGYRNIVVVILYDGTSLEIREDIDVFLLPSSQSRHKRAEESDAYRH